MPFETENPNLAKLLKLFGYNETIPNEHKNPKYEFHIPENSVLGKILKSPQVESFLQEEERKFTQLFALKNQESIHSPESIPSSEPITDFQDILLQFANCIGGLFQASIQEDQIPSSAPAFGNLARFIERLTAFSGVQHWVSSREVILANGNQIQSLGLLLRAFFSQFYNINAAIPFDILYAGTIAPSQYDRYGKSGVTVDLRDLLLFNLIDFNSVALGDRIDPRVAHQNYAELLSQRDRLAVCLSSAIEKLGPLFNRDSLDTAPGVQEALEDFAIEEKRIRKAGLDEEQRLIELVDALKELNKEIAEIKGIINSRGEAKYNEAHFTAGILLATGYFCLDALTKDSLDEYKQLLEFRAFLSSEVDATPKQRELLNEIFDGVTEEQKQILSNPQQMREKYLTDYAKYFKDIVASHKKRVDKLMEENKTEEALVLAMQADYFSKFTTPRGVQQQFQEPLGFIIYDSLTKKQEKIDPRTLSDLLEFDLKEFIDKKVKEKDKEDFQRIMNTLKYKDFREIISLFQGEPETSDPDGKLSLSKFLQHPGVEAMREPYCQELDQKLDTINKKLQDERCVRLLVPATYILCGLLCIAFAIYISSLKAEEKKEMKSTAMALLGGMGSCVVFIGAATYIGDILFHAAKVQQIETEKETGRQIKLSEAVIEMMEEKAQQILQGLLYCVETITNFNQEPSTVISGASSNPNPTPIGKVTDESSFFSV